MPKWYVTGSNRRRHLCPPRTPQFAVGASFRGVVGRVRSASGMSGLTTPGKGRDVRNSVGAHHQRGPFGNGTPAGTSLGL